MCACACAVTFIALLFRGRTHGLRRLVLGRCSQAAAISLSTRARRTASSSSFKVGATNDHMSTCGSANVAAVAVEAAAAATAAAAGAYVRPVDRAVAAVAVEAAEAATAAAAGERACLLREPVHAASSSSCHNRLRPLTLLYLVFARRP